MNAGRGSKLQVQLAHDDNEADSNDVWRLQQIKINKYVGEPRAQCNAMQCEFAVGF